MPIIMPDTSEVNKPIEPGTYPAKCLSVDFKTSAASNPMIVVKQEVTVGEKHYTRNSHLVITGAGAFGYDSLMRACHFDDIANQLKAGEKIPFDTDCLIGQEYLVVVDADTYNGAITDTIKSFLPK